MEIFVNSDDVAQLINRLTEQGLSRAYLQALKPLGWRPKGYKLRTAFGLGEILNVIDRDEKDHTSVVFTIEKSKIEKWLRKNS